MGPNGPPVISPGLWIAIANGRRVVVSPCNSCGLLRPASNPAVFITISPFGSPVVSLPRCLISKAGGARVLLTASGRVVRWVTWLSISARDRRPMLGRYLRAPGCMGLWVFVVMHWCGGGGRFFPVGSGACPLSLSTSGGYRVAATGSGASIFARLGSLTVLAAGS